MGTIYGISAFGVRNGTTIAGEYRDGVGSHNYHRWSGTSSARVPSLFPEGMPAAPNSCFLFRCVVKCGNLAYLAEPYNFDELINTPPRIIF